jgi:hypothetical protein
MKSRIFRMALSLALITLFAATAMPTAAQDNTPKHHKYKLIDIGTFGGALSYLIFRTQSMDQDGLMVGAAEGTVSQTTSSNTVFACALGEPNVNHAFAAIDYARFNLGALAPAKDNCSQAWWVSDNGQIAGASENGVVDPLLGINEVRAVFWKSGKLVDLGTLGGMPALQRVLTTGGRRLGLP